MKVAVITVSDRGAAGLRRDESGPILMNFFSEFQAQILEFGIIPDEPAIIRDVFRRAAGAVGRGIVISTGGTGLSPRDNTPESVEPLLDVSLPGFMEALRRDGRTQTPMAALSRGISGRIGQALVITLPGSTKAVSEACGVLRPLIKDMLSKKMLV